jgi:hypothetical protein
MQPLALINALAANAIDRNLTLGLMMLLVKGLPAGTA